MRPKYEREIEEILVRLNRRGPREPRSRRWRRGWDRWRQSVALPRVSVTPAIFMIGSLGLAILSYPLRLVLPQFVGAVLTISLVFFVVGLVLGLLGRNRGSGTKTWRGRRVDYTPPRPAPANPPPWEQLWRRLRRWHRTRHWGERGR